MQIKIVKIINLTILICIKFLHLHPPRFKIKISLQILKLKYGKLTFTQIEPMSSTLYSSFRHLNN